MQILFIIIPIFVRKAIAVMKNSHSYSQGRKRDEKTADLSAYPRTDLACEAGGVVQRTVEVGREDCGHDTHIETRIADFESPCEIQENVLRIHL